MFGLVLLWLVRPAAADPETAAPGEPSDVPGAGAPPADPVPTEPAPASEPVPAPGPAATDGSFEMVLREAKQRYFQGDIAGARELLGGLQARFEAGEDPAWELVVDALTYFGEIAYEAGDRDAASATFRLLLERDLQTPISPYHHPLEVVSWFEVVRNRVQSERDLTDQLPPVPFEVPPAPLWTFAPFGIPQLAQGRPVAGAVYGGLQAGLGVASFVLFGNLKYVNIDPLENPDLGWTPAQSRRQVQLRRYLVQWPVTIGFYATWGISSIDAARWHQKHAARVTIVPGATPRVVLSGSF